MNIEISAGLAWWLTLRGENERRFEDLVARALAYLPTGPKAFRPSENVDLSVCTYPDYSASLRSGWPADRLERDLQKAATHGIRVIANAITHFAWRNGPVEKCACRAIQRLLAGSASGVAQDGKGDCPSGAVRLRHRAEDRRQPQVRQCVAAASRPRIAVHARASVSQRLVLNGIVPCHRASVAARLFIGLGDIYTRCPSRPFANEG